MNRPLVYNSDYYNTSLNGVDDETMGWITAAITAGSALLGPLMGLFGGGRKAQFQGLAEINSAGQQATQAMDQIKAALSANPPQMSPQEAVQAAQKIVTDFNNPAIVYPAQKGNDAAARNNFIQALNQSLQEIKALAATVVQNVQAAQAGASGGSLGGVSTNTLILVGGGLLAVMMLKRD